MLLEIWVLTYLKVGLTKGWFDTFIMESSRKFSIVMQKEGQTKGGKEFQRPVVIMKMLPTTMNLHEEVMRDTLGAPAIRGIKDGKGTLYIRLTMVGEGMSMVYEDTCTCMCINTFIKYYMYLHYCLNLKKYTKIMLY